MISVKILVKMIVNLLYFRVSDTISDLYNTTQPPPLLFCSLFFLPVYYFVEYRVRESEFVHLFLI